MKKNSRVTGFVFMLIGAFVLLNSLGRPSVAAVQGRDVIRLVASGGLLGIGLVVLMGGLQFKSSETSREPEGGRS